MFPSLIHFSFANILSADEVYTLIFCFFSWEALLINLQSSKVGEKKIQSIVCEKTSFHYLPVGAVISQATRPRENRELNTQMHTHTLTHTHRQTSDYLKSKTAMHKQKCGN